ncbi:hypothetical protein ACFPAF_01700 [Hymenobacter endophyticus]|uniref:SCP domain-containing protein n=1 Tax=Hymenobacter endophyticus TaxID=3076335 RepID=A0ABU3TCK0_9BACT|nr:hypothetical protein [Hymenobacter endophyticus]MDU0369092.1 hypothetical protein [Hymenobacter endophyticus]
MIKYYFLSAALLFSGVTRSQNPQHIYKPACDLKRLNDEYVKLLEAKRKLLNPKAQKVMFTAALLPDAVLHNRSMEERDKLYHSDQAQAVELIGMSSEISNLQQDPKRIALYIWNIFNSSIKGHCEAQEDVEKYKVAVSCSQKYFVVRFQPIPTLYGY